MTGDNLPHDPSRRREESPFEDRLRATFDAEHRALEARRPEYGDVPIPPSPATDPRPWRVPAFAFGALCLVALIIGGALAFGQDSDGADEVIVGAPVATAIEETEPVPGATLAPTPSATSVPTAAEIEAAADGTLPAPSAVPTRVPPTPIAVSYTPCADEQGPQPGRGVAVVNIPADDPDGGLVTHTLPGVDTPVVGVLPPGPTSEVHRPRNCIVLPSGAVWWELLGPDGPVWGNAGYLAVISVEDRVPPGDEFVGYDPCPDPAQSPIDTSGDGDPDICYPSPANHGYELCWYLDVFDAAGNPVPVYCDGGKGALAPLPPPATESIQTSIISVAFPLDQQDPQRTENVNRVTERTDPEVFAIEQWLAGPTGAEMAMGLLRPVTLVNVGGCGGDQFVFSRDGGSVTVQLCGDAPSAGVGQDARTIASLEATLLPFPEIEHVALLDRTGWCVGDLNDGTGCLDGPPDGCAEGETVDEQVLKTTPAPADADVVDHVRSLSHSFTADCTTIVIELGAGVTQGETSRPASFVGEGIEVSHSAGVTRVHLPETFDYLWSMMGLVDTWGSAVDATVTGAAVLVVTPDGERDYVWISNGSADTPSVSFLSNPARIVIGICCNPTLDTFTTGEITEEPSSIPSGYFVFPPNFLADGSVLIEGLGAAFEASGGVVVLDPAGQAVEATYSSPTKPEGQPPSDGRFRVGNPGVAWQEFSVTIAGLASGDYQLQFISCDQCDEIGPVVPLTVP